MKDLASDGTIPAMTERVVWWDSGLSFASTWLPEQTVVERAKDWDGRVTTVGQVVYEDTQTLVLGLSRDGETGAWAGCFAIFKPCILERTQLG